MVKHGHGILVVIIVIIFAVFLNAQISGLSIEQIESLLKLQTPDTALQKEILQRGLSFTPTRRTVTYFKQAGAGPLTIDAIRKKIPLLEEAKKTLPQIIASIYTALNEGNSQKLTQWVSPRLSSSGSRLDRIWQPFTYRAHYIENMIESPSQSTNSRAVEVTTRVLFSQLEERCHKLIFFDQEDEFVLERYTSDCSKAFSGFEETIKHMAKEFFYALKANDPPKLKSLVSDVSILPDLDSKFTKYMSVSREFAYKTTMIIDSYKGLKLRMQARTSPPLSTWDFYFDKINGQFKIVKWKVTVDLVKRLSRTPNWVGDWGGEDSNMETLTLRRFGL